MNSISIRRLSDDPQAEKAAWAAVRDICCRTGNNGQPIAAERWEFFSQLWIEPYQKLLPEWTYVAVAGESIIGYLTGCPDSRGFFRRKAWRIDIPLLLQVAVGRYRHIPDVGAFARRMLGLSANPERRFSLALIRDNYPAHLHINVAEGHRHMGIGRRLIEIYIADLRLRGVTGVHLFCGAGPVEFYRRLNFTVLETVPYYNASLFALGQRL
jgi:GNAT superfamily N-acetyltransferase